MTTTPNAELAYRVLDHIEAHPKNWDQGRWITRSPECGTSGCFAGWAVMLSGYKPVFPSYGGANEAMRVLTEGGDTLSVSDLAERLLGARYVGFLDADGDPDDDDLFAGENSFEDLQRLVAELFGPRPSMESDGAR